MSAVELVNAEVLRVAPGEVLIVKVTATHSDPSQIAGLRAALDDLGLKGRSLLLVVNDSHEIEFGIVGEVIP